MRIVFLGLNSIGRQVYDWLLDEGEIIVALLKTREEVDRLADHQPDLVISGGFRHILRPEHLAVPTYGCINMHKALLPYNRGANPNFWTIYEQTPGGVAIHWMDSGIDTGDLLARQEVPVYEEDTGYTLYQRLERAQIELFKDFWPRFRAGEVEAVPQERYGPGTVHTVKDFKAMRKLDLDASWRAGDLLRLMRAMTFPPFDNLVYTSGDRTYAVDVDVRQVTEETGAERRDYSGHLKQYKG